MRTGSFHHTRLISSLLLAALGTLSACAAGAQQTITGDKIGRLIISEFAGVSGYWFTDATATRALGTPKFGGDAIFYVRPAHRSNMEITGGLELAGASDHWLPFTGGNSFSLTGGSVQISGEHGRVGRLVPYVRAGLFAGNVHSERQHFDTTVFAPSMSFGAEIKVHRYVTISAKYRISGDIGHVNTDGFSAGIHIF
jgi:hypothetical protein